MIHKQCTVVVVVNICIPSGSSHAGLFPDLLIVIRRVGSSVVPPPSVGSPRGSSGGVRGAAGLLILLTYLYQPVRMPLFPADFATPGVPGGGGGLPRPHHACCGLCFRLPFAKN
jgi:hypothetical protein